MELFRADGDKMRNKNIEIENLPALVYAIALARKNERLNCLAGHGLVLLSVIGSLGLGLLAYAESQKDGWFFDWRVAFILLALLPTLVSIAEKSLKPSEWEAWYARKALALEAILRHSKSANPNGGGPTNSGALPTEIVDWWNNVDNEFERTRPSWGIPESLEANHAKRPSRENPESAKG